MSNIKSMTFNGYVVNELLYQINEQFTQRTDKNKKMELETNFHSTIFYPTKENISSGIINIRVELGNKDNENCPFHVETEITATFGFEYSEDNNVDYEKIIKDIKNMLATNGNAIVFPYIRSLVSDLTNKSNLFPSYIFPTINFVEELKSDNNIDYKEMKMNQ